jgi:hypothetical protein
MFALVLTALLSATKGGVTLPDAIDVEGRPLILNGLGVREASMFKVDVYVAGLYLEKKTQDGAWIIEHDSHKRLVMHFVRDVGKGDLLKGWSESFARNGGAAFEAEVKKFAEWMDDMKIGDQIVVTYVPTKGVTVSVKTKTKGTIASADFAKMFWSIFVGANPPNASLKSGLLGT